MAYRSSAAWATGGESVLYLGRHYRLKVHAGETGAAKLRGGWLHVPAPHGAERTEHLRTALVAWFRRHAAVRLPERVAAWSTCATAATTATTGRPSAASCPTTNAVAKTSANAVGA